MFLCVWNTVSSHKKSVQFFLCFLFLELAEALSQGQLLDVVGNKRVLTLLVPDEATIPVSAPTPVGLIRCQDKLVPDAILSNAENRLGPQRQRGCETFQKGWQVQSLMIPVEVETRLTVSQEGLLGDLAEGEAGLI